MGTSELELGYSVGMVHLRFVEDGVPGDMICDLLVPDVLKLAAGIAIGLREDPQLQTVVVRVVGAPDIVVARQEAEELVVALLATADNANLITSSPSLVPET